MYTSASTTPESITSIANNAVAFLKFALYALKNSRNSDTPVLVLHSLTHRYSAAVDVPIVTTGRHPSSHNIFRKISSPTLVKPFTNFDSGPNNLYISLTRFSHKCFIYNTQYSSHPIRFLPAHPQMFAPRAAPQTAALGTWDLPTQPVTLRRVKLWLP